MRIEPLPTSAASAPATGDAIAPPGAGERALDRAVAARWTQYLARLDAPDSVRRSLDRLAAGAGCVVTGQQAGVLTGPMLTILKAARAVSLARELEARSGKPVVPVFWIAGDDHDLDEIHHTFVIDRAGELRKLRLELGGARGAASEVAVPDDARRLVDELWQLAEIDASALPPGPFHARAGDSLSTWFARSLLALLGEEGLVPFEPALLGEAARGVFEQALASTDGASAHDGASAIGRALRDGADALRARGIVPPLPIDDEPPLFLIERGARSRVHRNGSELLVKERTTTRAELLACCGLEAPRLSANVALRPVLQAACLPTLAYVAGPNEIVYYEQTRPLHQLFGVTFPALVPRPQATVLSISAARALRKLDLPPAELFAALDARKTPPATRPPLLARGDSLRADVARYVEELLAASPPIKTAASRRATQLLASFDAMLERAAAAHRDGEQVAELRWSALETLARPRGKPQDRSLNVLPFLAEHGRGLIDAFLRLDRDGAEPTPDGIVRHWLVSPD